MNYLIVCDMYFKKAADDVKKKWITKLKTGHVPWICDDKNSSFHDICVYKLLPEACGAALLVFMEKLVFHENIRT